MKRLPLQSIRRRCMALSLWLLGFAVLSSGEDLTVLSNSSDGAKPGKQFELYLKKRFHQQVDERLAAFEKIKSMAEAEKWALDRYEFFLKQIGGFPALAFIPPKPSGIPVL